MERFKWWIWNTGKLYIVSVIDMYRIPPSSKSVRAEHSIEFSILMSEIFLGVMLNQYYITSM